MGNNFDRCDGSIHIVKKGDTLYKIAKMHNSSISELITANPYVNVYNMQIGDEICIPAKEEDKEEMKVYIVKEGDTFDDVMKYTGVGPSELFQYNKELYDVKIPEGTRIVWDED